MGLRRVGREGIGKGGGVLRDDRDPQIAELPVLANRGVHVLEREFVHHPAELGEVAFLEAVENIVEGVAESFVGGRRVLKDVFLEEVPLQAELVAASGRGQRVV